MPVVEITQLRLKGLAVDDPALLKSLSLVRGKLQTNSRFFSCIEDSSLVYIFGLWPSLDAHLEFLASPTRDEVLAPQEEILDFQWTIHLELDAISPLLLDAPFIAMERLNVNPGHVDVCNKVLQERVRHLRTTDLINVTYGWRCDMSTRNREAVIITSSNSKEPCVSDAGRQTVFGSNDDDGGAYHEIQIHHARNMEHTQSGA